jgi:hypothetical protein
VYCDGPGIIITVLDDGSYQCEVQLERQQEKTSGKEPVLMGPSYVSKTMSAKSEEEVQGIITKYLPALTKAEKKEDDFEKAFKEATA